MGLTLVAIFTAALLLPGIIASRAFYLAAQTREVEVPVPSLSTPNGIAVVGGFSVVVHAIYVVCLRIAAEAEPITSLPLANPYLLFVETEREQALDLAWSFFAGLTVLTALATIFGLLAGRVSMLRLDKSIFYGPLTDLIQRAAGDDRFIVAYVLTKIENGSTLLGYQGIVDSLYRDSDRFPTKIVLIDAVPFYLKLADEAPERIETNQSIDTLVLYSDDWHNIAFSVIQVIEEPLTVSQAA